MMNLLHVGRKIYLLVLALALMFNSCDNNEKLAELHHPAEFESCDYTSFVWTDNPDFHAVVTRLVGIISKKDKVKIYIEEDSGYKSQLPDILKRQGANLQNVDLVEVSELPKSVWFRDYGPVYLVGENEPEKIVDFKYFGKDLKINKEISTERNIPLVKSTLSSSGGAREVNGKGTIILCEAHELDVNRPKSKAEIEKEIKKNLNLKKVIWLKQGIPQDDNPLNGPLFQNVYPNGVNGHVDEFCRFVNSSTILISSVNENEAKMLPVLTEAKNRLDENYNILINSTDQDGNKFNVIKVPFAPVLIAESSASGQMRYTTPVTSYMNFIITNSFIILPSYASDATESNRARYEAKDKEAVSVFQKVFPEKEIISVPSTQLNYYSGGFHCLSLHEPAF